MPTPSRPSTTHAYNSWIPVRADAWSRLEESSRRMTVLAVRGEDITLLESRVVEDLDRVRPLEQFFAFPGLPALDRAQELLDGGRLEALARHLAGINRALVTETYRGADASSIIASGEGEENAEGPAALATRGEPGRGRPHFEVLVVGRMSATEERELRERMWARRRREDAFTYELVVVGSGPEAMLALELNPTIQAVILERNISHVALHDVGAVASFLDETLPDELAGAVLDDRPLIVADRLAAIRPEVDLYLLSEIGVEELAGSVNHHFRRVFHAREGALELHLSLLAGVGERYRAPFFEALRAYAHRPTGVFHALPISQGKSIVNSHWISDMVDFYGLDIFLAETSATGGGLDSLLEPTGPLREAQRLASQTFGSRHTYFATNGTSTANKIVAQALVAPGDIVLVDRNCHQSHHYGMMLAGAHVTYLEAYPLDEFAMYGAVPLREIKRTLLALKAAGKLDRVRMLMLTNCTFDGVVYDVERVMEECLAIKPDLVFLWDEAWFAFARFHPVYRARTAMRAARTLGQRFRTEEYRDAYAEHVATLPEDEEALLDHRLMPDPQRARVRVYSTQSTHKTLTSLRQGSMIHVHDEDFAQKVQESFHEAYMAHTSTSPNYQVLASLDLGRRQAALEGYDLVQRQIEYAMRLRDAIDTHPLLSRYLRCLTTADMIPAQFRPTGIDQPLRSGRDMMQRAWSEDQFVLDPSRISLYIGPTGIDGATFKREQLMDRFGIQVNKTSRNTVLFMTNIGTTRSSVAYLIEVLVSIVRDLEERRSEMSLVERAADERRVEIATTPSVALPNFSAFHDAFRDGSADTPEGDVRAAFYLSYDDANCEYVLADEVRRRIEAGEQIVSTTFVTPYPPGFPVLVPGQVFTTEIVDYLTCLDTPEVHGYNAEVGFRVYTQQALALAAARRDALASV